MLTPSTYDADAAQRLADAFYASENTTQMRDAAIALDKEAPESALRHEVRAELAFLAGKQSEAIRHLLAALNDPRGDAPLYVLHRLTSMRWDQPSRQRIESALERLQREHPDNEVKALVAWMRGHAAHLRADLDDVQSALSTVSGRMKPWIVGPFDNDQGKGFDAIDGPEEGLNVRATYDGKFSELSWRDDYLVDPRGKIDLFSMLYPGRWQSAYAANFVSVNEKGKYELRVSTNVPVKVWVDGILVASARRLGGWVFDGLVIPISLDAGKHAILVKSAQNTGGWLMHLRLTGEAGAPLSGEQLSTVEPYDAGPVNPEKTGDILDGSQIIDQRTAALSEGARKFVHGARWRRMMGISAESVAHGQRFTKAYPRAFHAQYLLALAAWDNEERGQAADLLNKLVKRYSSSLPEVILKQARFWQQQKMTVKARTLLRDASAKFPDVLGVGLMLAESYGPQGWDEERCALIQRFDAEWPYSPHVQLKLANCFEELNLYPQAQAVYEQLIRVQPNNFTALRNLLWHAQRRNDFTSAIAYGQALTKSWPQRRDTWDSLAEVYRRAGRHEEAKAMWQQMRAIAPHAPKVYDRLAQLALQEGRTSEALDSWRKHLTYDPDNEKVSRRIAWLEPEPDAGWLTDVPSDSEVDAAIAGRGSIEASPGANMIYLLDDEVTFMGADGGASSVVTLVAHALNQVGRDRLTRMTVRAGGPHQILRAYAVLPDGRRIEASSIRGRTLRFRQLAIGSTVVLQYRIDERPDGYLSGHLARRWWFQGAGVQTHISRWVLWRREGIELQTSVRGEVEFDERTEDGLVRSEWLAKNLAPVSQEPYMPGLGEVASNVLVSTVPGWEMFWKWEQALLLDAFRDAPELVELAVEVTGRHETVHEKLRAIQTYLMTEIRYQQDYEKSIAGVKPHAAPVVVARQYGDCKDKAVLFITLARLAGIQVHFALVRTRDMGPVERAVPMQQFNHAIVYVPAQDGLAQGRFYDPTVDGLDVPVLRHDNQGTLALVYDPVHKHHRWQEIPFQDPEIDVTANHMIAQVDGQGRMQAEVEVKAQGRFGSLLRRGARNAERFEQMLEKALVAQWVPGATMTDHAVLQLDRVTEPARLRLKMVADTAGRLAGGQMRIKVPINWRPARWFSLGEREHDLLLGTPRTMRWSVELEGPSRARVVSTPNSVKLEAPCLSLERQVRSKGARVILEQEVKVLCERIESTAYEAHREVSLEMLSALEEDVVLRVP